MLRFEGEKKQKKKTNPNKINCFNARKVIRFAGAHSLWLKIYALRRRRCFPYAAAEFSSSLVFLGLRKSERGVPWQRLHKLATRNVLLLLLPELAVLCCRWHLNTVNPRPASLAIWWDFLFRFSSLFTSQFSIKVLKI